MNELNVSKIAYLQMPHLLIDSADLVRRLKGPLSSGWLQVVQDGCEEILSEGDTLGDLGTD